MLAKLIIKDYCGHDTIVNREVKENLLPTFPSEIITGRVFKVPHNTCF